MVRSRVQAILETRYPKDIATNITESFLDVEKNYRLEKWKTSELDAGHFVESVRRLIEFELQGTYTDFSVALGAFSQTVLSRYESLSGAEEYRILIPRILYAMYCVRNKRGVGHIASVVPNKLDATLILQSCKWVLGELTRLVSSSAPEEAKELIDQILFKQVDLIWDDGETYMVLSKKLKAPDKSLLVLYRQDRLSVEELRIKIQYKNKTTFRKILAGLQSQKYIAITSDGYCKLSPLGHQFVERLILAS